MDKNKLAVWILRIGLALAFLYPAISAFASPLTWEGFIPYWIVSLVNVKIFLPVYSSFEILLAVLLLLGRKLYFVSLICAIILFLIVIFNFSAMEIVFRDISLGLAALSLAILTKKQKNNT